MERPTMKIPEGLVRFASSDPDYAPFGLAWLRGLTLARFGLVAAVFATNVLRVAILRMHEPDASFFAVAAEGLISIARLSLQSLPTLILVIAANNASAKAGTPVRVMSLGGALVLGAFIFSAVNVASAWSDDPQGVAPIALLLFVNLVFVILSWGGLLTAALFFLERERRTSAATRQASLDSVDLDRQLAEAQLQLLQAQIEPHFLFNSLATVRSLYGQDESKGRRLIGDLSEYLRGALPNMREAASTLRRELALSEAYLRVVQVRMGERLRVEMNVPHHLEEASVPPMMLPTLIENAVKHGIAPVPKGGTVQVRAEQVGERLRIAVSDDGAGFRNTSGAGVGLANTRARLASLFGTDASLRVVANSDAGVTATLEFPLRMVHSARQAA
jgi:signal transduction histidine kinase